MTDDKYWPLGGGMDLVTPSIRKNPGRVIDCINYEPVLEGYRRIQGYERYDGQPKPSLASYWLLDFDTGGTEPAPDAEMTGSVSNATGKYVSCVLKSGSWATGDAAGFMVLRLVSGVFETGDQLGAYARAVGTSAVRGADTDDLDEEYHRASISAARLLIQPVPGSGPLRGVWVYKNQRYAFRDSEDGSEGRMYKAMPTGWELQVFGKRLDFSSGGTTEILEGDTITGATSGATAKVERLVLKSGSWSEGTASGYMILSGQSGTFQAEELNTDKATVTGDSSQLILPSGGLYQFDNHNFYGSSNLKRMYGCNGVGNAFEWDGSVFCPIETGMVNDAPSKIAAHNNHLFLIFPGGSLQHSSLGEPLQWQVITGAGEIGMGDEISGILPEYAGAMAVFTRNKVAILYGNDKDNWELKTLSSDGGAIDGTVQLATSGLYMDDQGVRDIKAAQEYSNFSMGTLTSHVKKWLDYKKKAGVKPVCSVRVKSKDQYRLFFSDNTFLIIDLSNRTPEIMACEYDRPVKVIVQGEENGEEVILFGSDDGYVYQADTGNGFDGSILNSFLRLPYNHFGTPTQNKQFFKAFLEVSVSTKVQLYVQSDVSYGNPDLPEAIEQMLDVKGGGGFWDISNWNEFYWSSPTEGTNVADIPSFGSNLSLLLHSNTDYDEPHILTGVTVRLSMRKKKK